jgi:hypothetical protein
VCPGGSPQHPQRDEQVDRVVVLTQRGVAVRALDHGFGDPHGDCA